LGREELALRAERDNIPDSELVLRDRLLDASIQAGVQAGCESIVNFYVALKSKPLALLVGERHAGKLSLVNSFAKVLVGENPIAFQKMPGHTWWGKHSENIAVFARAQTKYNTTKIIALIEEALQPENHDRMYFACLDRISPGELHGYFSNLAFQIQHGEIMLLPGIHLTMPIPFPPNLVMVATMDVPRFDWFDQDILSQTTIIRWQKSESATIPLPRIPSKLSNTMQSGFLKCCVRSERKAWKKLEHIPGWGERTLRAILEVESVLMKHGVQLPRSVLGEALIYLANAWSFKGQGLFDPSPVRNMNFALDMAISQSVLPHGWNRLVNSAGLREDLCNVLGAQFPHSLEFLEYAISS
jgi:hypothetical protein